MMQNTLINKYPIPTLVIVLAIIAAFTGQYASLSVLFPILVIQYFYYLFYVKRPKSFYLFLVTGLVLYAVNWIFPTLVATSVFSTIAGLECCRVILMAILRYPQTIETMQALTEELEKRVEDRTMELKEANEKLHRANLELRELDKMKSAFVSQASHDLRTPLAAIKGSLDNLHLGVAGELNEKQSRILQRAIRSVDRLTDLINDVLDLSRIESGRTVLTPTDIPIEPLVAGIVSENQPAAQQKNITLHAELNAGQTTIHADPGKIERVVGELISNAIKYTPDNGTIEVTLSVQYDKAVLTVKDSGIGISREECRKIWERFYRTNASKNFAKGSGLGLSIAKELVEMHGGKITVESEPNQGTTFTLSLPIQRG